MTHAERNFNRSQRLSKTEVSALAREVLERARQALRDNPAGPVQVHTIDNPTKIQPGNRLAPRGAQRTPASIQPAIGAQLAGRIRDNFEYVAITFCLVFSGTAWLTQQSGAQF